MKQHDCPSCSTPLVWLRHLDHRPLEATPVAPCPGDVGWVVVRRMNKAYWEPSSQHPNATEHLRIHRCYAWRDEKRGHVDSLAEVLAQIAGPQ